jgi:hypothetical protein
MQASLRAMLGRTDVREGEGILRGWREEMLLAAIAPARAKVLARRFRQNAIVAATPNRKAKLLWVAGLGSPPPAGPGRARR